MAMGSPEWIEESLARLERMEQQRDNHEKALEAATDADALRHHSESIDRLDEEIKQLYAVLEEVAEDEEEEEPAEAPDEVVRTHPFGRETPARAPVHTARAVEPDEPVDDPFAPPKSVAAAAAPATPVFAAAPADLGGYDAEPQGGGSAKWIVVIVLLVAGGGGGFVWWKNNQAPPAAKAAPVETKVIDSSAVPLDTQGPRGAQGQEGVTRTPERELGGGRRGGGGGGRPSSSAGGSGKKSNGKAIELKPGDDPLG